MSIHTNNSRHRARESRYMPPRKLSPADYGERDDTGCWRCAAVRYLLTFAIGVLTGFAFWGGA